MGPDDGPRRGRPADPQLDTVLAQAAREVLAEHGWRGATVERIAERAGVARTTVYRRYGSLHGVLLLMMGDLYSSAPVIDTGSLRGDLVTIMKTIALSWRDPAHVDYICAIVAAQRENAQLGETFRAQFRVRRADTIRITARAAERGELDPRFTPALLLDLLSGLVFERVVLQDAGLTDDDVEHAVDALLSGFAAD